MIRAAALAAVLAATLAGCVKPPCLRCDPRPGLEQRAPTPKPAQP